MTNADTGTVPAYRLEQWMTLRMQLLWAYEREMEVSRTPVMGHYGFQSALYVREGWIEAGDSAATARRAEAGQWLVLRQGDRWQRYGPECGLQSIGFRFQVPTGEAVYDEGFPLVFESRKFPRLGDLASEVLEKMERHIGLGYFPRDRVVSLPDYLHVQNVFRDFLMELAEVFSIHKCPAHRLNKKNPHVLNAFWEMENVPIGEHRTAAQLARRVGLSLSHLDRLMVADTGATVHEQMERRRLALAEESLQSHANSLKGIAFQLGFSSPSHFSSWFKKRRGVTPGQYRAV